MAFRVATGRKVNLLERCATAPVPSPAADTRFPIGNLSDGYPDQPFMFGAVQSGQSLTIDLNTIPNGGFETAFDATGLPTTAWVKVGAPTITRMTGAGEFSGGTAGCRVAGTRGTDYIYFDVPFLAGEQGRITVATRRGVNVGEDSKVYVQNLQSGDYLQGGGAWDPTKLSFASSASTVYATVSLSFTVESFAQCGNRHAVTLRVILDSGGTGPMYDDLYVWASAGFASIHGHNIDGNAFVELLSGANSAAGSLGAFASSILAPTMCKILTITPTDRFFNVRVTPANTEPIWYGELVLAQAVTMTRFPSYPVTTRLVRPQLRSPNQTRRYRQTSSETRQAGMLFAYDSAGYIQARDEIVRRSANGEFAVLAITDDADPASCLYSTIEPEWGVQQSFLVRWNGALTFTELPLPTFMP